MKLHSIVSKALQKSSCTRIPGIFCISFTIIFSCPLLSQRKISSSCTSPRLSSEFYRTIQFSNCLVVCHYHDFSPKQIRSSEPFFNTLYLFFLYDGFIMSKTNQIRELYFHFIKQQQSYLQSCFCRAIGKTNSTIVWCLENELNCHDDDDDTFIKVSKL